jgi:hypothetical protein
LTSYVLLGGLLRRLSQVLLTKAKQTLSALLQRGKLLLCHFSLRQTATSQTHEPILIGTKGWV